ncbi:MAG: winged helix DNA-binding domain-containing protein [Saprospiraceae bacterium]
MTYSDIAQLRIRHQHLHANEHRTPAALVRWMGAVQAQDYAMAKWALGIRMPGTTDDDVEQAINRGEIIRTHILRPTWHFVVPEDLPWLLDLTAKSIGNAMRWGDSRLGLEPELVTRSVGLLEHALRDGAALSREEIAEIFNSAGIPTDENRLSHLLMRAEMDRIARTGPRRGKQVTYVRLDLPAAAARSREENLAALALRYFTSHGPATLADFNWWSGLSTGEARAGLEAVGAQLEKIELDGQSFWFAPDTLPDIAHPRQVFLLPAFDEYLISYRSRNVSLDPSFAPSSISSNGIFYPVIVSGGRVEGTWKRTVKKNSVSVQPQFFKKMPEPAFLGDALAQFGAFLGLKVD